MDSITSGYVGHACVSPLILFPCFLQSDEEFEDARNGTSHSGSRSQSPTLKPTWLSSQSAGESQGLKLPPCGPYDNFLVAAGC
jgi:hypothetical protein